MSKGRVGTSMTTHRYGPDTRSRSTKYRRNTKAERYAMGVGETFAARDRKLLTPDELISKVIPSITVKPVTVEGDHKTHRVSRAESQGGAKTWFCLDCLYGGLC